MVQDIKITPSGAGDKIPQMLFTGSGATAINMELNVQPDSRLSYESNEGEVFSISKGLQSGVIFAVKDISGLDQISVNASGDMHLAPYYGAIRVGATGIDPAYKLDVFGADGNSWVRTSGISVGTSGVVLADGTPGNTTNALYNVGGTLTFDGSTVGGGGITWDGSTANGVATYKDADEATVESNLTFDGSTLTVTGDLSLTGSLTSAGEFPFVSGVAAYASGNTANIDFGSNVQGDILYHNGTSFIRLAKGTDNYVLTMDGSNPVWEAAGGGSAAGSDTQVQFNDGGSAFGGDADFTWNKTTNVMTVNGHISASTKSFLIDHPTKPDKKLQYACLEGPENGVYVRGHTNDNLIDLPNYWTALVDPESITVQLTAKDAPQPFLYVSGVLNNQVHLISDREISAYYVVNATRKDVEPLLVEPNNYSN